MKKIKLILLFGLLVLLAACKFETYTELYTSDLEVLAAGKASDLPANIAIAIEMPSEKQCMERSDEIVGLLGQYFSKAKFDKCSSEGLNNFLSVRAQVPVVTAPRAEAYFDRSKGFMFFLVRKNGERTEIFPYIHNSRYGLFRELVKQRYGMDIETDDLSLDIVLKNDSKAVRLIEACSVYIDHQPVPLCGSVTLSGREYADILVSKVQTKYLVMNGISEQPLITIMNVPK